MIKQIAAILVALVLSLKLNSVAQTEYEKALGVFVFYLAMLIISVWMTAEKK
jgi:hypothetical protein